MDLKLSQNDNLGRIKLKPKTGNESLTFKEKEIGKKLIDFWMWSVSDIVSNATRGRFAEFIVATAMNVDLSSVRDEWSAYDLTSPEEIKIEVKSASYLQSWSQKKLSEITFDIRATRKVIGDSGTLSDKPSRPADVYVFCLLKHKDKKTVEPLNLDQWEFFVLSTSEIDNYKRSQSSITLNSLKKMAKEITFDSLRETITEKYKQ